MGFLDKLKGHKAALPDKTELKEMAAELKVKASEMKVKAADLAAEHSGQIDAGIDKAAGLASKATKGKFDEKIETAADKAKDGVNKIGEQNP